MRNKLLWFYQEVNEPETAAVPEQPKPGPSRAAASNNSKTPQGKLHVIPQFLQNIKLFARDSIFNIYFKRTIYIFLNYNVY